MTRLYPPMGLAAPDFEPPLAGYVLAPLTPLRIVPRAEIVPISWNAGAPECPRLANDPLGEVNTKASPSSLHELAGETQLVGSDLVGNPRPSVPLWVVPVALTVVVISALGILLFGPPPLTMQRSVAAKDRSAMPQQVLLPATSFDQPAFSALSVSPLRAPEIVSTKRGSYLSVQASAPSWVVACADGKVLFSSLFTAGDHRRFKFNRDATIRVGSAGSIQVLQDGKLTGALGHRGQVRIVEFKPDDSYFLNDGEAEDCTYGH